MESRLASSIALFLVFATLVPAVGRAGEAVTRETYRTRVAASLTPEKLVAAIEAKAPGQVREMFGDASSFLKDTVGTTGLVVDIGTLGSLDEITDSLCGGIAQVSDGKPLQAKSKLDAAAFWLSLATDLLKARSGEDVTKALNTAAVEWGWNKATGAASSVVGGLAILPANLVRWFLGEVKSSVDTGVEAQLWKQYLEACSDLVASDEAGRRTVGRLIVEGRLADELLRRFDEDMYLMAGRKGLAGWDSVALSKRHREAFRDKFLVENRAHLEAAALGELQRSVQAQLPALKEALGARLKEARSLFEKPLTFRYRPVDGLTKGPVTRSLSWHHEANPDHRGGDAADRDGQAWIRTASSLDVYPGEGADELVLVLMAPGYLPHRLVVPVSWREALDRKTGQDLGEVVLKPAASGTVTVTVTSAAPSERDRFACSLGSAVASSLEKDEKAGRFAFRVLPGTWLVIATEGNHGAQAREVTVADGAKLEVALKLERLPTLDVTDPARDQLPAVLPPSASSSTAAAEVREALRALAGSVEGGVEAIGPRAAELVTRVHEAVASHQSGRVMAQMERWQGTLTGDALQAWWPKRGAWVAEYVKGLEDLARALEEGGAAVEASGEEGIRRQNEAVGRSGRLRSSLRRPPQWDSLMPLFLPGVSPESRAIVATDPTPALKAALTAETEAVCVEPATLNIHELRRAAEARNPFASRVADGEREAGNAADARTRASTAAPEVEALVREVDDNLAAHGLSMVVARRQELPRTVSVTPSSSRYLSGSRTKVVSVDCGSMVGLTTSLRVVRDEVAALLAYLEHEAMRRAAHRDALREAASAWSGWQGRVRARLAAEEAEEARVQAELERLVAEMEARSAELQRVRTEVGARVYGDLRRRSGAVEALKPGPTTWSLEARRQAVEAARDSAFVDASAADLGRLQKAVDGLEATNAALNDLLETPAYGRLPSKPRIPETHWGRSSDGWRPSAVVDARRLATEGRSRLLNVVLARGAADGADGAVTAAAAKDGEYVTKLGEAKELLEKLRVASADLDAFARAWTAEVERDRVEPLRALLTEVGAATVATATRELAADLQNRLRDFDHLRSNGLGGAFHRWYLALAEEYRAGRVEGVLRRIDESWTSPGGGTPASLESGLTGLFAAGPVASISFKISSVTPVEGDSRRFEVTSEVRVDHRPGGVGRGTEKVGSVTDVVVLRPDGARIVSTTGDVWAVTGEGSTSTLPRLSHCQLGAAALGSGGQERLVPADELRGADFLVLAGIAAGGRLPVQSVRVSLDGGLTFADAATTSHGTRVLFSFEVPLGPGTERRLVLEARSAGGVTRYPAVDSLMVRCVAASRLAVAAQVASGLLDAWKRGDVGAVGGRLADGLWSGRDELLAVLAQERLTWKVEGLVTDSVAAGPAGPQTRIRLGWRGRFSPRTGGSAEARGGSLDLYLDGGLRVTDLRGDLPFGFTSKEQVEEARYSPDAATLRGRLRVDHGREMENRDGLRLGVLFDHGLVMPVPSASTETVDVALGFSRVLFAVPFGLTKVPGTRLADVRTPPGGGYGHAVFNVEPGAVVVTGCRGGRWAAFQLQTVTEGDPDGELVLRYVYHADRATLPYTRE